MEVIISPYNHSDLEDGINVTSRKEDMLQIKPWLERDFAFDTSRWMFPHVVERVRGGPARLEDALRNLSETELTVRPGNAWSIQEEAGHLLDIEPLMLERLDQLISGASVLRAWDGTNEATWNANHNARQLQDILEAFRNSRQSFAGRLDSLPDELIERSAFHPRLKKPMRIIDLAFFVAEHDDYHLARVTAAKRSQSRPCE
jgi:uncharacterized damage-inducible protein DinB